MLVLPGSQCYEPLALQRQPLIIEGESVHRTACDSAALTGIVVAGMGGGKVAGNEASGSACCAFVSGLVGLGPSAESPGIAEAVWALPVASVARFSLFGAWDISSLWRLPAEEAGASHDWPIWGMSGERAPLSAVPSFCTMTGARVPYSLALWVRLRGSRFESEAHLRQRAPTAAGGSCFLAPHFWRRSL